MSVRVPRVVRHFASMAFGNYTMLALSLVLSIVVARRLGPEGFGRLAFCLMAIQVLTMLVFNWTMAALIRFGAQEYARTASVAETFWARLGFLTPWLVTLTVVSLVWQRPAAAYLGISVASLWILLAYFISSQLLASVGGAFQASQHVSRYGRLLCLDKTAALVAVLMLPSSYARDPESIIACYASASVLVLGWAFLATDRGVLSPVWPRRALMADMARFSLPMFMSGTLGLLGGQAIIFAVIRRHHPVAELGMYSLANQTAAALQQIAILMSLVLLPRLSVMVSRREDDEVKTLVQHVVPYGLLGVTFVLSIGAIVAKIAIPIMFGESFRGAVSLLAVLIAGSTAAAIYALFVPFFNAYGLTWTLSMISMSAAALHLAAVFVLVPTYGVQGAAAATVVGSSTGALLILVAARRRFRLPSLRFALLSLPVVAVVLVDLLEPRHPYLVDVGAMIVGTAIPIMVLRLFNQEDLAVMGRLGMPHSVHRVLARFFRHREQPQPAS